MRILQKRSIPPLQGKAAIQVMRTYTIQTKTPPTEQVDDITEDVGFEESASKSARQSAAEEDDNLPVPASTKKPYNKTAP